MKNIIVLFVLVVLLISTSCTNEIVTPTSESSGKLILKVDKQNAPSNVVFVKAYLTRENFDPIVAALNLLTDSTADLLLNNINAGIWHLKVDAENDSGLVLYTGETDVEVFAGFTSQVYLTLQPTGAGVGSIYINVNWGVPSSFNWTDYQNNPILTSGGNYYDYYGIAEPSVFYENGHWKMYYYCDSGGGRMTIGLATSQDGLNWVRYANNPVIQAGSYGQWDSYTVTPGPVIKENGIYKMYYNGWADQYGLWHIGLATSVDGINWEKSSEPILYGTSGWEAQIGATSIVKKNGTYLLYYFCRDLPNYRIGVAISTDGLNFIRYQNNPILVNDTGWEANGVFYASVIEENNTLKMVYMNSNSDGFGLASSSDGFIWQKSESNPFFKKENTSNLWGIRKIAYPNMIKFGNETRIYYTGDNYNDYQFKIGLLRKSN